MKTRFFQFVLLAIILIPTFSCKKLLDARVESDITEQVYWKNEADFQNYLTGIYGYYRARVNELAFGEERSEMYIAGSLSRFTPYWSQVITPDNSRDWQQFYACVGHTNLLLDKMQSFNFRDLNKKDQIAAEALCLRASMYFHIARIFGDIPLSTEPVVDEHFPLLSRTPVNQVFDQINHDIDSALTLFPNENGIRDKYFFSRYSALALKADVNMWQAKVLDYNTNEAFNTVISSIESIENNSGASLLDDFRKITDRKNQEIIWSLSVDRSEATMYSIYAFPLEGYSGGADNAKDLPIASAANTGYATFALSPLALNIIDKYPTDTRKPVNYITEITGGKEGLSWPNKFRGHIFTDGRIADDDIIMYRLGGMILLKAEAYAALKNSTDALIALNQVRQKRNIPDFTSTDIADIDKEILEERGRELFFENKRWYDLVRAYQWGTLDIYNYIPNLIGKTTPIYWPIQTRTRSLNPNL